MLPLDKCRRILGPDCDISQPDLERLREQMCDLATVVIEGFEEQSQASRVLTGNEEQLEMIPEEDRHEVEERAAIIEFLGGKSRSEAEQLALKQYFGGACP